MKKKTKKYLYEGLLIVFSVLFALFITKLFDDYKIKQQKKVALESIKTELNRNSEMLKKWEVKHSEIRKRITNALENNNDSLKNELKKYQFLNMGILTNNESLIDGILSKTAWETAKSTGIIAEFDFSTTEKLTEVYSLQSVLTDRTLIKLLDYYFDPQAHDIEKLDQTLLQFQLRFWELTGQELLLGSSYEKILEEL